jgi:hypothetical protein
MKKINSGKWSWQAANIMLSFSKSYNYHLYLWVVCAHFHACICIHPCLIYDLKVDRLCPIFDLTVSLVVFSKI